jgi:DNA polymerase-3 subunit epsilon
MQWIDTACVARRAWMNIARSGYGLANVCQLINYPFKHHDALEDAKASGEILLAAIRASNLTLEQWLVRVTQPIDPTVDLPIRRKGNPEGELFGEVIVFTGSLTIPRREAADLAAEAGCEVEDGVTKRTTMLVVGVQDIDRLNGYEKSAKQRKAEGLIAKGQTIRVLFEDDFKEIVASAALAA